ncbi:MAG TPA: hypothetical protein VHV78_09780 [Gemmatimonadaceae bacterium]|nr:hypothetical protein [Gemmatimonadaceae bacterium]
MDPSRRNAARRHAGFFRGVSCFLALVAMAGQVGVYVHLAFTAHVTCAEHGELIEAGSVRKSVAAADDRRAERTYVAASSDVAHGHEHCIVAAHRRLNSTEAQVRSAAITAQLPFIARVVVDNGPPSPIALIFLAPKNSPPLA